MSRTLPQEDSGEVCELNALGGEGIWTRDVGAGPRHHYFGLRHLHLFPLSKEFESIVFADVFKACLYKLRDFVWHSSDSAYIFIFF